MARKRVRKIPEWFFDQRERVYDRLKKYLGSPLSPQLVNAVEQDVNDLLRQFKQEGHPVKVDGTDELINGIELELTPLGRVQIHFY